MCSDWKLGAKHCTPWTIGKEEQEIHSLHLLYNMRQSNQNFNIPPTPWAFDHFLCPGGGEFDLQGLPGGGDLTFAWVWWGKLTQKWHFFFFFFFPGIEVANVFRQDGIN